MKINFALSYHDVLLVPQKLEFGSRQEIDLKTKIAPNFSISIPLISVGMDTVTGPEMAVALCKLGGISFYPRFDLPEIEAQKIREIKKQKAKVIASIGVKDDWLKRTQLCLKSGADAITLDIAHAHCSRALEVIADFKNRFSKISMLAGTIATYEGAMDLYKSGADCVRVGVGAGTICTTRIVAGSGVPQITAIMEAVRAKKRFKNKFVIADGGATTAGDIIKGLAAGADAVACGSLFAGTEESPGKIVEKNGVFYKEYNASTSATEKNHQINKDQNHKKPHFTLHVEGVESVVKYKGSVKDVISQLLAGIRSGFSYSGAKNIQELHRKAKFIQISNAGYQESLPHDVQVV